MSSNSIKKYFKNILDLELFFDITRIVTKNTISINRNKIANFSKTPFLVLGYTKNKCTVFKYDLKNTSKNCRFVSVFRKNS